MQSQPLSPPANTLALPRLVPIAPAAGNLHSQQHQPNGPGEDVMPYTCMPCARRKVKCNKTKPCSACRKGRLECLYQAPPPRKRKRKAEDLAERLQRYERLLRDNGLLRVESQSPPAESSTSNTDPALASPRVLEIQQTIETTRTGKLIKGPGKTRYVDSNVWNNLGDDLHMSLDEDFDDPMQRSTTKHGANSDSVAYALLSTPDPTQDLLPLHPTYENALKLWRQYCRNVDPIIKVIHVPTGLTMVQRSASNPSSIPKVTECLLFSIYHFAVCSSTEQECLGTFGDSKVTLQRRYHDAVKQALVGVHFLRTTEMAVLQAFIHLLLAVRNQVDPHTFWILTGIAIRIGQRMGLHRDGEELGVNPYDLQMRRRLWWQLLPLDGIAAQLCGTGIAVSPDSWDTKQPLNLFDEDISPGMGAAPVERKGATDMIYCLCRSEIGRFHQKVKPALSNWRRTWDVKDLPILDQALRDMENTMEEKYIRYCDISNPVHCLAIAMCRASLTSARLRIRLPRSRIQGAQPGERKELCEMSVKILNHDIAIHQNHSLSGFAWHLYNFFQWDPLICILNECRHDSPVIDVEAAWSTVGQIFEGHPEMMSQKRSLDAALARLATRAWDATQARRNAPLPEPPFIVTIRKEVHRRESSRQSTEALHPRASVRSFDPLGELGEDLPVINYIQAQTGAGYMNFDTPTDWDADLDWMFWDQLAPDADGAVTGR